jgi:Family of unknown function (DUF6893)
MLKWIVLLSIIGIGVVIYRQAAPDIQRYMRIRNM